MKEWQVWVEGYLCTGMEGIPATASKVGSVSAATFKDACGLLLSDASLQYDSGRMTVWGCRLFDNEADARKAFG